MSNPEPVAAGTYDLAVVRDLLLDAFTAQDYSRLFLYTSSPNLRHMNQEFSPNDGLIEMVDRTIEYCSKQCLLDELLREVQQANPRMYARFEPRLRRQIDHLEQEMREIQHGLGESRQARAAPAAQEDEPTVRSDFVSQKSKEPERLRIFLSHSSDDKPAVRRLYQRLRADGFDPWLDDEKLLPGQDWELEIRRAARSADVVIVCLSKRLTTQAGYVHKEIRYTLDLADEQPEGTIFLIPLRLDECELPERLQGLQWVDYYKEDGYKRLVRALEARAQAVGSQIDATVKIERPVPLLEHPEAEAEPADVTGDSVTRPAVRKELRPILVEVAGAGLGAGLGLALCLMLSTLFVVRDISYLFRSVFLAPIGVALGVLALAGALVAVFFLRHQGEGLRVVGRIVGFWLGFVLALVVIWLPLESYTQSISPLPSGKNLFQTYVVGGSLWAVGIIVGRELVAGFRPGPAPWQASLGGGLGGAIGCVLTVLLAITLPLVEPSGSWPIKIAEAVLAGFGLGGGLVGGWAVAPRLFDELRGRQLATTAKDAAGRGDHA